RTDEPTRFDAQHAAFEEREHTARDEQRYESMNVARVFGGDASEEEEESSLEHERAEEAAPANAAIEEPPALEQHPWKAPSQGVVEEEEIEEEEMEMPGFQEDPDMTDFEEMEEEVLGQSGEQMLPMGNELMEAVRDAHVNERATGKYEAEGLGPE